MANYKSLNYRIKISWIAFIVIVGLIITPYISNFGGTSFSNTPADWGALGDYFGGFLNPLVALFAFYWLKKSISLQLDELKSTSNALSDSADAQEKQLKLELLKAKMEAISTDLQTIDLHLQYLKQNGYRTQNGITIRRPKIIWIDGRQIDTQEKESDLYSEYDNLRIAMANNIAEMSVLVERG